MTDEMENSRADDNSYTKCFHTIYVSFYKENCYNILRCYFNLSMKQFLINQNTYKSFTK